MEQRLIDANELKTQIPSIEDEYKYVRRLIDEAPTIDAVPVIRCKDCKRNAPSLCPWLFTGLFTEMKDEDFCSYFERRNDGTKTY